MRIWIIEDDEDLRELLFESLQEISSSLIICEATPGMVPRPSDVVIMDLLGTNSHLLEPNGATVIRMTGAHELPADIYKPFKMESLIELVRNHIDLNKTSKQPA